VPFKSNLLLARFKAPVAIVEWNIVDAATGREVYRRKQAFTVGFAEDGSAIPGETAAQMRARVLAAETALRDAKLAEFNVSVNGPDVEATGADQSAQFAGLQQ
jgi:hypothetical protein